jgi:hypothetical protein
VPPSPEPEPEPVTEPSLAEVAVAAVVAAEIVAPFEPFAVAEATPESTAVDAADYFAELNAPPAAGEPAELAALAAAGAAAPERVELAATYQASPEAAARNGAHAVAQSWPTFVGGTSELIDRDSAIEGLFDRVRAARDGLVASGAVVVDLSLRSVTAAGWTTAAAGQAFRSAAAGAPVTLTTAELLAPPAALPPIVPHDPIADLVSVTVAEIHAPVAESRAPAATAVAEAEVPGPDLVEMRERLKLGPDEAAAVAAELEAEIAAGRLGPLLARVLGEAYLKLGRADQAAAQFRQAIALRGRRR